MYDAKARVLHNDRNDYKAVYDFLSKKYLYWLEGISLCRRVDSGIVSMTRLWSLVQVNNTESTWYQVLT